MVPSTAGSPSHGGMKKLHIHSGANTHYTYTHTSPTALLLQTLNDEVRNFEVESQKNTHI